MDPTNDVVSPDSIPSSGKITAAPPYMGVLGEASKDLRKINYLLMWLGDVWWGRD